MTGNQLTETLITTVRRLAHSPIMMFMPTRLAFARLPNSLRLMGTQAQAKKTCLYDFHVEKEGKMVDFAGYLMPVQYGNVGIAVSHKHTRSHCSLFDVSHMLQTYVHGKDREKFMESLTVADVKGLAENQGTLSLFTNANGGVIDDLIVNKTDHGYLYVVSNAGCRHKDMPLMQAKEEQLKSQGLDVSVEFRDDLGLLALQGPMAAKNLQTLCRNVDLSKLYFMTGVTTSLADIDGCRVTRCGYTGEDGFEISVPGNRAAELADKLVQLSDVQLAGLGARDSLRLEAGLCLYGNDIDEETTPVEAGLVWTIGKRRRNEADFPGAARILDQIKTKKVSKRRIGLISKTGAPARSGCPVVDPSNPNAGHIGQVTSGCPSPSLGVNIAMAYVKPEHVNGQFGLEVRKKIIEAEKTKMPFVKTNYYMPPQ